MVRYLALLQFTEQGIKNVGDSVKRAADFRTSVEGAGGSIKGLYWAVGEADGAVIFEAPDDASAASLLLGLGHRGFVRTRSLRLFDAAEFGKLAANAKG